LEDDPASFLEPGDFSGAFALLSFREVFDVMWCLMLIGTTTFSRPSERAPNAAYSKTISEAQDLAEFSRSMNRQSKKEPHIHIIQSPSF